MSESERQRKKNRNLNDQAGGLSRVLATPTSPDDAGVEVGENFVQG